MLNLTDAKQELTSEPLLAKMQKKQRLFDTSLDGAIKTSFVISENTEYRGLNNRSSQTTNGNQDPKPEGNSEHKIRENTFCSLGNAN